MTAPTAPNSGAPTSAEGFDVADVDKLVHEPARMAILSVLDAVAEADFRFLETTLRMSKGNLSSHLSKLEEAGLVTIEKGFRGRRPHTTMRITDDGRQARARHWEQLERLRDPLAGR